ncbi:hypothetical protein [Peribacillus frigoritolerans]|uniref:hypothetical protein n=1 Tax=Peribacillus frigoritolerans TaxID=450367 RepID=UPI0010711937|nr:hypothetical protein [Peribacillus frigoritolerans]TFH63496.1 hypothetical protein E4J71_07035 [Peribacillus frigoritolerans]
MEKEQLLKDLKEIGTSFHLYRKMSSDSAEQKTIQSAKELEQENVIRLEVCKVTKLDFSPVVEIKGQFI